MADLFTAIVRCKKIIKKYNTRCEKMAEEEIVYEYTVEPLTSKALNQYISSHQECEIDVRRYFGDAYYEPRNSMALNLRPRRRLFAGGPDIAKDVYEELVKL